MVREEKLANLNRVFSPTAPIKQRDFFHGRLNQLTKIVDAINESGQHAILYGERGVGKTSLANIMVTSFTNLYPVKVTCNKNDDFKTIWKQIFEKIQYSTTNKGLGFNAQQKETIITLSKQIVDFNEITPSDVVNSIGLLPSHKFLFIFDEFDNIINKDTRSIFADLIKSFSDNLDNATIVIVGIADNVEELIGSHQSLERCLKQVKMPRMSNEESVEIIENGLKILGFTISESIKKQIIEFSSGFPHYVHLICKYGCKEMIINDKTDFNSAYLKIATKIGIENTSEQLRSSYQKAIIDPQENSKWKLVLNACATSETDQFNCFTIGNVLKQYNASRQKKVIGSNIIYNLNQLCTKDRGEVLKKSGKGVNTRFRFVNPMMRAFIKLKLHSN
jgi:Cdc6-like AAA superfamily ATPase